MFCQEVPTYQLVQGMHEISAHIVSRLMHSQGLNQNADLKQRYVTMQRTLDLIKEETGNYPYASLLSCIQSFGLICMISRKGISTILCSMADYEFNNETCFETVHAPLCRSTVLSLSDCDKEASSLLEHSSGRFNLGAMEKKKMKSRHLEMRNIFSPLDDTLSMSMLHLKERLLLTADSKPH